MKSSILILASVFLFFGCQNAPDSAGAEEAGTDDTTTDAVTQSSTVTSDMRPDPQNPGVELTVPVNWMVRFDRPNPDAVIGDKAETADLFFVNMAPGWHVTSGPSAIYYHPRSTAEGNYTATMDVHLFDPGDRREAFGLFIGGANLDAENQTYDYFLIRNSGEYLIKRRTGSETSTIQDWTQSSAVKRYTQASDNSVMNKLQVTAGPEDVAFLINEMEVARLPRADVQAEGLFGFRVNHGLDLHISDMSVKSGE